MFWTLRLALQWNQYHYRNAKGFSVASKNLEIEKNGERNTGFTEVTGNFEGFW